MPRTRPDRWRQALGPYAALWAAAVTVATLPGHDLDRLGVPPAPSAIAGLLLAWITSGLLAPLLADVVAAFWLGRWPIGAQRLTARRRERWDRSDQRIAELADGHHPAEEQAREMASRARIAPSPPCRPTWMGDRWAAVEHRVATAYGLDLVTLWPRLWLVLPEPERAELRVARVDWDRATRLGAWAVLFAGAGLVWWPILGAAMVLGLAGWARGRAAVAYRADLVEAVFDRHAAGLPELFTGLDPEAGRSLTADLRKGV